MPGSRAGAVGFTYGRRRKGRPSRRGWWESACSAALARRRKSRADALVTQPPLRPLGPPGDRRREAAPAPAHRGWHSRKTVLAPREGGAGGAGGAPGGGRGQPALGLLAGTSQPAIRELLRPELDAVAASSPQKCREAALADI